MLSRPQTSLVCPPNICDPCASWSSASDGSAYSARLSAAGSRTCVVWVQRLVKRCKLAVPSMSSLQAMRNVQAERCAEQIGLRCQPSLRGGRRTTISPHWNVFPGTSDCTNSLPIAPTASSARSLTRHAPPKHVKPVRMAVACRQMNCRRTASSMSPGPSAPPAESDAQIHTKDPVATPKQTKCRS